MATSDGWYVIGPLIAVALVGALGVMFWRIGVDWIEQADDPLREMYGLAIFAEPEDYGLLCPAAITDEPDEAEEIRLLLADAGIRCHPGRPHRRPARRAGLRRGTRGGPPAGRRLDAAQKSKVGSGTSARSTSTPRLARSETKSG